jgi:integral membrane protein
VRDPLLRYRVMANVVGVVLIVLVFIAVPLRYLGGHPTLSKTVSPIHGALYIVLVVNVVLLGRAHRWPLSRIVLVALGGTVPIVSFLVERRVAAREAAATVRA